MTSDDALYKFHLHVFALAGEYGWAGSTPVRSSTRAHDGPRPSPRRWPRTSPLGAGTSRRSPRTTAQSSRVTRSTLESLGAHHRRIVAGRPQSNG